MDTHVTVPPSSIDDESDPLRSGESQGGMRRWQVVLPVCLALAIVAGLVAHSVAADRAKPVVVVRAVPVVTAPVKVGDVPVNLSGLGTVIPTDSVTVRTRVDGQIMAVNFREGQMVRKGDLLLQIDPRPYQVQLLQAEGQMAKDEAALKNARMDLERFKTLVKQGIISQQQMDTQVSTVDQDEAAAKADLGAVESAKLNLVYSRIIAPVSGKVGLRLVDQGNMVHATDTTGLVVITPLSPIDVLFTIPADNVQHVLANSRGVKALSVEAWDRDFAQRLALGKLVAVDNQVDTTTGTVRLKAEFANTDASLFPNQFVNAKLKTDTLLGALTVPAAAVQRSPKGNFVYVVKADSTVDMRPVEIQVTEGDTIALKSGVRPGEQVVVDGLDKLRPGSKVSTTEASSKVKQ